MRDKWRMHLHSPKRSFPGLAERVKSARTAVGLSQQVTATRAGMSTNRLRDVERYGLATTETISMLARALSIDVDVLLGRKAGSQ
jgi:ribosome-binding protein aMBF1 (putative translation factor)